MKSSACRNDEHEMCSPLGRVRLACGKTIGCDCDCHLAAKGRKEAKRLRAKERKDKE